MNHEANVSKHSYNARTVKSMCNNSHHILYRILNKFSDNYCYIYYNCWLLPDVFFCVLKKVYEDIESYCGYLVL